MKEVLAALAEAKKEFDPVIKDRANDFFNSKYATLGAVLKAVGAALDDAGLLPVQTTSFETVGERTVAVLWTRLYHVPSGEFIESSYPLQPVKNDPQGMGSALTFARRYALMTMFGLNAEDDDGNASTQRRDTKDWDALLERCKTSQEARVLGNQCNDNGDLTDERKALFKMAILTLETAEAEAAKAAEPTVEGVAEQLGATVAE